MPYNMPLEVYEAWKTWHRWQPHHWRNRLARWLLVRLSVIE